MPSKPVFFYFFIGTSLVLILAQMFVYFNLRRILRRDFPAWARKKMPIVRWIFIAMNLPLLFLFFRREFHGELVVLADALLYPFSVWEITMLIWAIILIPVTILRLAGRAFHVTSAS